MNRTRFFDLLFIAVIAVLVFISFITYQRADKLVVASGWVEHTNNVKLALIRSFSNLKDAESSVRGFLLAGYDTSMASGFKDSRHRADSAISELKTLVADNNEEVENANLLEKLIKNRYAGLDSILTDTGKRNISVPVFLAQGNMLIEQIRSQAKKMADIENALLLQRRAERERYAYITPFYSLLLTIIAIIIIALAYYSLKREIRLRSRAEDSQATIHNFFMQVPASLAILKGPQHRFEFANPPYIELIGNRDIMGKQIREALPEIGNEYYELLDKVYKTGEPFIGMEMPVDISRNGTAEKIYVNFVYQSYVDTKGETQGILVFCYDVSEMVLARKRIQEAEERSRLAVEAASMGTFDWNFTGGDPLSSVNFLSSPRLKEIFGFAADENVLHTDLLSRFVPEDKLMRDRAVLRSYEDGTLFYEARLRWPDNTIHWVNVHGKIVFDKARQPARMFGTVIDITPQKKILEEIKENESRFRLLANSMPQIVWTSDAKGNINYFNDALFRFSGFTDDQIQGEGWIKIVHPDDQQENINKWMEAIRTGNEFFVEHRFRNYKNEYRWQMSRAVPQRDDAGNIQQWIGTSTDIQDQKEFMNELEEKVKERTQSLREANERLEEIIGELVKSNEELKSFNYIASHDLQEPLRKINAFSERIYEKEKERMSDFSKDYFGRIVAASKRMQSLIDAFLSYSQANTTNVVFEETDLNKLFIDVLEDLRGAIEEKKAVIQYGNLPTIKLVPFQAQQLFVNLLNNSMKYSKAGVAPVIRISSDKIPGEKIGEQDADKENEYWQITIEDNGIGFEQEYEHKIFGLFQRLHRRSEYSGTGIGLAICKKIMSNHHGFIKAIGKPGEGATFILFFPATI